jgi:hypothetical protein
MGALYDLLSSDWKGDAIIFLGDQTNITDKDTNPVMKRLSAERQAWGEPGYDDDFNYNPYGVKRENPYEGLFIRESSFFRYTINHTKKEFFDIENTRPIFADEKGEPTSRINPLPILMSFPGYEDDMGTGLWLGDKIEVSDNKPPSEYKDMSTEYGSDY